EVGMGYERYYLATRGLLRPEELPRDWNLLELQDKEVKIMSAADKKSRSAQGFRYEMNLLLASLRRVEVRIEHQSITDFLKWKNRITEYNRGSLPEGMTATHEEHNSFLCSSGRD